jgi:hypothetical protein
MITVISPVYVLGEHGNKAPGSSQILGPLVFTFGAVPQIVDLTTLQTTGNSIPAAMAMYYTLTAGPVSLIFSSGQTMQLGIGTALGWVNILQPNPVRFQLQGPNGATMKIWLANRQSINPLQF